jgi:hypothetical protein
MANHIMNMGRYPPTADSAVAEAHLLAARAVNGWRLTDAESCFVGDIGKAQARPAGVHRAARGQADVTGAVLIGL